jgi:urease accessory protein
MLPPLTHGCIFARFEAKGGLTKISDLYESGGLRLKFPRAAECEAVLMNTAGGVVGGDILDISLKLGAAAKLVFTTASAERIYRTADKAAEININLELDATSYLEWLPQENILYSGAALRRKLNVALEPSSRLMLCETMVFGRTAMGENVTSGFLNDQWRIRLAGKVHFCESLKLDGNIHNALSQKARGSSAKAMTNFLYIAPDAETRYQRALEYFNSSLCEVGVSAFRGMLVVRGLSPDAAQLKECFSGFIENFRDHRLPRLFAA